MRLLFVCTHNACRSILGEAITRAIAGDRIEVESAGSSPAGRIHPLTLQFLADYGYGSDGLHSKGFEGVKTFQPDAIITVCDSAANESCPVWISDNAVTAHWGLPDPSRLKRTDQDRAAAFGSVIETLKARIEKLLQQPFEAMDRDQLGALLQSIAEDR